RAAGGGRRAAGETSFTDSALEAGTSYTWTVAAVDNTGKEGARSAPVTASTTGGGSPATCVTANNYAHVAARDAPT
ncbi:hypothetical protein GA0115257_119623, partial [Streptomyces sp. LcepLS]